MFDYDSEYMDYLNDAKELREDTEKATEIVDKDEVYRDRNGFTTVIPPYDDSPQEKIGYIYMLLNYTHRSR